ncbi:MAG TPA: amino acid adenylation domain-containing protein [Herpetosiphonaceae bacterium]
MDFTNSPFFVNTKLAEWQAKEYPRRAGVSSFGIGGTNAHIILEEAPPAPDPEATAGPHLLALSAKTQTALETATTNLLNHLKHHPEQSLADVAYTLQVGRKRFNHRRILACRDHQAAIDALEKLDTRAVMTATCASGQPPVVFLFPGQGAQSIAMAAEIYRSEPVFRETFDRCADLLLPLLGLDLRTALYANPERGAAAEQLNQTALAQPALFAVEYALAQLWLDWGIQPVAMLGHSIGEYVAATLADVMSLEEALKVITMRGQLMQSLPDGAMLAVPLPVAAVQPLLIGQLCLAAHNGPQICVVAGPPDEVRSLAQRLEAEAVDYRLLHVSRAFHSAMMDPILETFTAHLSTIRLRPPTIPFVSNVTGTWITAADATDPAYWTRQLRQTVRFAEGLQTLFAEPQRVLLEVGPGQTLTTLAKRHAEKPAQQIVIPSLAKPNQPEAERLAFLRALGQLWLAGIDVDWRKLYAEEDCRRVALPTYPFERERYWIGAQAYSPPHEAKETAVSETETPEARISARQQGIVSTLGVLMHHLTGDSIENVSPQQTLLELGFDSLLLIQFNQAIQDTFGVRISLVQLLEQLTTLHSIAAYIDEQLPPEQAVAAPVASSPAAVSTPQPAPAQTYAPASPAMPAQVPVLAPQPIPVVATQHTLAAVPMAAPPAFMPATNGASSQIDPAAVTTERMHAGNMLERIMSQQLQLLSQHLALFNTGQPAQPAVYAPAPAIEQPAPPVAPPAQPVAHIAAPPAAAPALPQLNNGQPQTESAPAGPRKIEPAPFVPYRPLELAVSNDLTPRQRQYLEEFTARYTKRTQRSKQLTQHYRPVFSDSRSTAAFRLVWKELIYPIIGHRSEGSRIWDVDGNEYVDVTMGFGVHLFGHSPRFIMDAIEEQMKIGLQLGPQSYLAGEVSRLICELTGVERVNFCNSGTEAVMGALRIARTITRRTKIACFAGSYHGWADMMMARPITRDGQRVSMPMAPGVPARAVEDMLILDYDRPESLEIIRAHAHELAAVMVEPVQSRRPDLQPRAFLQALRQLTEELDIPLIFDEMVNGFRIHPGGAQAHFGVRADIVTYGKVVGGGFPIGVIAGKARFMDAFDGGMWNYGDASYPQAEKTLFAGAFFKHPLTMAAALAVLNHMQMHGPALHDALNQRTTYLAETLNAYFEQYQVPIHVVHFSSVFRFNVPHDAKYLELFFYHLTEKGIYNWEGGNCFLSTAHTDEDIDYIVRAVKASVEDLRSGGFLPELPPDSSNGQTRGGSLGGYTTTISSTAVSATAGSTEGALTAEPPLPSLHGRRDPQQALQFSLYYFGNYESVFAEDKYDLLFKGVKFADEHDFTAVWIPERHFHSFGGFSPNPSVVAAALARETQHLQIRAGSVALPLHHPIRVAEEWSIVDNLSQGRVGISFASGWHPDDFVFAPDAYEQRRDIMLDGIEIVRKMWRGEGVPARGGTNNTIVAKLFPMPLQSELPIWLTCVHKDTYIKAGELGAGVLTNLVDQTFEELAEKIALYRQSLAQHGYDPAAGHVTILIHTFLADDLETAVQRSRRPFYNYLKASLGLVRNRARSQGRNIDLERLTEAELDRLLGEAYEGIVQSGALIGTTESCAPLVDQLIACGVDEIACLVDFGVETAAVLDSLQHVANLKARYTPPTAETPSQASAPIPAELGDSTPEPSIAIALPLTEAQKGLWVLTQFGQDASRLYNESFILRLTGQLELPAIRIALQQVIDRHESLRTTFSADGEFQYIVTAMPVDVPLTDITQIDAERRESLASALIDEEIRQPFDLVTGPLLRARLLKLQDQEHLFVLTIHHIITDGWSADIIIQELSALYSAACTGAEAHLPAPMQFREYIEWVERQEASSIMAEAEAYWLSRFADHVPVLELPTDRPRPPVQTFPRDRASTKVDPQLHDALKQLSAQQGSTLFMLLLSGFNLFLHRLTGQNDLVVGVPAAGQLPMGHTYFIGYCINILSLRSTIAEGDRFSGYLRAVRRMLLEAYEYQHYAFGKLVKQLNLGRDLSRSPLVSVLFNWEKGRADSSGGSGLEMVGLEAEIVPSLSGFAAFDMSINVIDTDTDLVLQCDYNTDLFDAETILRWLRHYETLLQAIADDPQRRLMELPLLSRAEQQRMLVDWNTTHIETLAEQCLHQLFEAQAQRTPDAVAAIFATDHPAHAGRTQLTYRELNRRANQVAHELRARGVGPEVTVGVCVDRSLELAVAVLGILKAGGICVPIDPDYPRDRLAFMLRDSAAPIVLTQQHLRDRLAAYTAQSLCLDTAWPEISRQPDTNPQDLVAPANAAYAIYTSGSTGTPKGALLTHRALVNYTFAVTPQLKLTAGDRVLQFASLSFDVVIEELFPAWAAGSAVVFHGKGTLMSAGEFEHLLTEAQITVVELPVAYWHTWVDDLLRRGDPVPPSLRLVLLGCEKPDPGHIAIWQRFGVPLINVFGLTETAITSTVSHLAVDEQMAVEMPIGRPVAHTQVYVLDGQLAPVPVGVPGNLYIGGTGLARGYLNRIDLTAERFIPNPFSATPGDRLYRTGDLARYRPDGNLDFLGRSDYQVKVRGFRIELGEIEAALRQNPEVAETIVLARQDRPGDTRLVAYLVPFDQSSFGGTDTAIEASPPPEGLAQRVRAQLETCLPGYAIPSAFVVLQALPLTANGKVDRAALPAPTLASQQGTSFVAPRTPVEQQLGELWSQVLGVERVGIHDNFFDLGGDSLQVIRLVAKIRDSFQQALQARVLFEHPTIADLAQVIEQSQRGPADGDSLEQLIAALSPEERARLLQELIQEPDQPPEPLLRPLPKTTDRFPLSFAQQRLWFLDKLTPGLPTYNSPALLRLSGALDVAALRRSLSAIVRRHDVLRATFDTEHGEPFQVIAPPGEHPLPVVDLQTLPATEREAYALQLAEHDTLQPFDLQHGPVLRTQLVRLSDAEHMLILNVHHIVFDQWSLEIFLQELIALYNLFSENPHADSHQALADLPVQYTDYAVWQREWLQGQEREQLLFFWKQQLLDAPPLLNLPTDWPRPAMQRFRGATHFFQVPLSVAATLHELSRQSGTTMFMLLLAAYQTLLYRYTGEEQIVVGTPVANRTRSETEGLIGLFLNTLVLHTNLAGNPRFRDLLAQVRETALDVFAHQELPFEVLVEELHPKRDLSYNPVFQVLFMFQNVPAQAAQPTTIAMERVDSDSATTMFDLALSMMSVDGGIVGLLRYDTDLFAVATIERMTGHFQRLLAAIAADANARIAELPLLTEAEQHELLVDWNATQTSFADTACLQDLVEAQAARTPDRVALSFETTELTFQELNARANQLAHHLRALGVGPETLVGLCLDRSPDLVVGVLGVLKAGGAYVPLDPSFPEARLQSMLADSRVSFLVAHQALAAKLAVANATIINLDSDWPSIAQAGSDNPARRTHPDQLAYVIYTSGSTGVPKGVQITHRSVINLLESMAAQIEMRSEDTLLAVTTLSFDIAVLELFLPLITGARLVLTSREVVADGVRLGALLKGAGVTVMQATPATWRLLLDAQWPGQPNLRMISGGEALPRELADRLLECGGRLWNVYGPTETTIWSLCTSVAAGAEPVSIGRPLANTQIYLLDAQLQPVPVGVAGELYIGGAGLARGYLNRPSLTAERFIPSPFAEDAGARLYRTGDLARYRSDGSLEFLGRIDHQVKVRGFRIELGEIETVLRRHPAVHETVVVAREDRAGLAQLVAYIIPAQEQMPSNADLRSFVREDLPDYMIPSVFVFLERFPLTPNGKIDRKVLPASDLERSARASSYVAPRTSMEQQLVQIWQELLPAPAIGVTDDFFDLGGHSLLAVRLMVQIQKQLGQTLPLAALFQASTIERLARILDQSADATLWSPLVPIQPAGSQRPFFAVHPIGGNVFCYADLAQALGPDQPFYGLQAIDLADMDQQEVSIAEMAASYIEALRTVQPEGPYLLGGWSFGGVVAFEMAQQLQRQGAEVALLALFDTYAPDAFGKSENITDAMALAALAREQAIASGKHIALTVDELQRRDPQAQLDYVLQQIKAAEIDMGVDLEDIRPFLRGYRARQWAVETYQPSVYSGPIMLFKSTQQDSEIGKIDALMDVGVNHPTLGWDRLASEDIEIYAIPGYHNTLVLGPNAALIAQQLKACLASMAGHYPNG